MKTPPRPVGGAAGAEIESKTERSSSTRGATRRSPPGTVADLPAIHGRLLNARRRLIEIIGDDYQPDRTFQNPAWVKMLADTQGAIKAVAAKMAADKP